MAGKALRRARYFVSRLPFFLLALKGVWLTLYAFGFSISSYWWVSELQAHSVTFCAVLAFYAYVNRSCLYLWVCIFSLFGLNVLNILYFFFSFPYLNTYAGILIISGLTFSIINATTNGKRRSASR